MRLPVKALPAWFFPGGKVYTIVFGLVCIAAGLANLLSLGMYRPAWMSRFAGWTMRCNIESRRLEEASRSKVEVIE